MARETARPPGRRAERSATSELLGKGLREMYTAVVEQGVPDHLSLLLDRLENSARKRKPPR
jgi:hypothetical protein